MSNVLGSKGKPLTEEERQAKVEQAARARGKQIRFRGGRYASGVQIKAALEGSAGNYLAVLDDIALDPAQDPRVRADCARYLIDRIAGKPTEKVQMDTTPVTFTAPTDAQMSRMAKMVRGEEEGPSNEGPTTEQPEEIN